MLDPRGLFKVVPVVPGVVPGTAVKWMREVVPAPPLYGGGGMGTTRALHGTGE